MLANSILCKCDKKVIVNCFDEIKRPYGCINSCCICISIIFPPLNFRLIVDRATPSRIGNPTVTDQIGRSTASTDNLEVVIFYLTVHSILEISTHSMFKLLRVIVYF
jgi:hypothetical protein